MNPLKIKHNSIHPLTYSNGWISIQQHNMFVNILINYTLTMMILFYLLFYKLFLIKKKFLGLKIKIFF